jgi:uncharacterized protein (TIGR02284 family)
MTKPPPLQVRRLNRLVVACYQALGASQEACSRLGDPNRRQRVRSLMADHQKTIERLRVVVRSLGGTPAGADTERGVERGKRSIGGVDEDRAVLAALKSVDDHAFTELDRALDDDGLNREARSAVQRSLAKCPTHRRWFEAQLANRLCGAR